MSQKPLLIYNPVAGKGSAGKRLPLIQEMLREKVFEVELVLTQGPGDALRLAKQAAEEHRSLVIAAGGDGTVNETLNGIFEATAGGDVRPALGVLPVGRGNDFAFGMNIPANVDAACDLLVSGNRCTIDVGRVTGGFFPNGRYFGNGVGLGFDTVVGFEAAKLKHLHGGASYLVAVIRTIFAYSHAPVYKIILDEKEVLTQPFLMVSIMNGRRMGGSFLMAPQSDPSDGKFDLCLAGHVPQWKIIPVAISFIQGKQASNSAVRMVHARNVSVQAVNGTIPAHADGETVCSQGLNLSIELLPAAIDVVCGLSGGQL